MAFEDKQTTRTYQALMWANLALIATVLFSTGMFYQRVVDLEARVKAIQSTDGLSVQIGGLQNEVNRLRDRLERWIESGKFK